MNVFIICSSGYNVSSSMTKQIRKEAQELHYIEIPLFMVMLVYLCYLVHFIISCHCTPYIFIIFLTRISFTLKLWEIIRQKSIKKMYPK